MKNYDTTYRSEYSGAIDVGCTPISVDVLSLCDAQTEAPEYVPKVDKSDVIAESVRRIICDPTPQNEALLEKLHSALRAEM